MEEAEKACTPGPWKVTMRRAKIGHDLCVENKDGLLIATINRGMSDCDTNAEMIAKVPEMIFLQKAPDLGTYRKKELKGSLREKYDQRIIEAYKAALRKEIEERIADYKSRVLSQESFYIECGELRWMLHLLDTAKPPEK